MKKMFLLGVVLMGILVANAATTSWKVSGIYLYDGSGKVKTSSASIASYQMILLYSTSSSLGYTIADKNSISFDSTVSTAYSGAINGVGGTGSLGKTYNSYGDGYYYYIALYNSQGTASTTAFDYYQVGNVLTGNPDAVAPNTPLVLTWSAANTTWTAAAAPEPASVGLLLLGLCALGLKRKVA